MLAEKRAVKTPFGLALERLARLRFGSDKAYALQIKPGASFVTQCKTSTVIGYDTLQKLLGPFALTDQEVLYDAWRQTAAPSPIESLTDDRSNGPDDCLAFALHSRQFLESGHALRLISLLKRHWKYARGQHMEPFVALEIGRTLAEALYSRDRRVEGIAVSGRMREMAHASGEPVQSITASWLEALGMRSLVAGEPERAELAFAELERQINAWTPVGSDGKKQKQELSQTFCRDAVLLSWDMLRSYRGGNEDRLRSRLSLLGANTLTNQEVLARGWIACREYDKAERCLADMDGQPMSAVFQAKTMITRVRFDLAVRNISGAYSKFLEAIALCEPAGFVHYRMELAHLQADLVRAEEKRKRHMSV